MEGKFREKKIKTYKFPSKNEYMYEVSSKSENGKMVKFRGKIFWGIISQGNFEEKKLKPTKFGCKISL